MANELAKSANFRCRFEGVVFFRHFLCRPDDRVAHKRVKTLFARGNRVRGRSGLRGWSGRRRRLLLPEQSNRNRHQCNKHKTESFVHKTPFGKSCHVGVVKDLPSEHPQSTIRTKCRIVSRQTAKLQVSPDCVFDASLAPGTCPGRFLDLKGLINDFLGNRQLEIYTSDNGVSNRCYKPGLAISLTYHWPLRCTNSTSS